MTHPDGVGESEGDSEGKTFRHGHHKHGDTNNKVVDIVANVAHVPWLLLDHKVRDAVAQNEDHHRHHRDHRTYNQRQTVKGRMLNKAK